MWTWRQKCWTFENDNHRFFYVLRRPVPVISYFFKVFIFLFLLGSFSVCLYQSLCLCLSVSLYLSLWLFLSVSFCLPLLILICLSLSSLSCFAHVKKHQKTDFLKIQYNALKVFIFIVDIGLHSFQHFNKLQIVIDFNIFQFLNLFNFTVLIYAMVIFWRQHSFWDLRVKFLWFKYVRDIYGRKSK